MSIARTIADFFVNIKAMGIATGRIFREFPRDPVGTLLQFLTIWLGTIAGLVLIVIWILLTVTGAAWVMMFFYATVFTLGFGILYTFLLIGIICILAVPYFGLWLIDLPTNGLIVKMMRCENEAHSWYERNRFNDDNGFMRIAPFVCIRPCKRRYTPILECCCTRLPNYMPDFCPQQQIYRTYRGIADIFSGPYVFDKFVPPSGFTRLSRQRRKSILLSAFKEKMSWYNRCFQTLKSFDYLNRHICNNISNIDLPQEELVKICQACREVFCNHHETSILSRHAKMIGPALDGNYQADAPNNGRGPQIGNRKCCADIDRIIFESENTTQEVDSSTVSPSGPSVYIMKRFLFVFTIGLCLLIMLYALIEAISAFRAKLEE